MINRGVSSIIFETNIRVSRSKLFLDYLCAFLFSAQRHLGFFFKWKKSKSRAQKLTSC